jgi:hypothetical protein
MDNNLESKLAELASKVDAMQQSITDIYSVLETVEKKRAPLDPEVATRHADARKRYRDLKLQRLDKRHEK